MNVGRFLVIAGLVVALVGAVVWALSASGVRIPLGRLPGDISWRRGNARVYVPIVSSLVLSVVLTVLLNLFLRR